MCNEFSARFSSRSAAEEALDYFQNQPGYAGCEVSLPAAGRTEWLVKVMFMHGLVEQHTLEAGLTERGVGPFRLAGHSG
jgi:hypothetical protein